MLKNTVLTLGILALGGCASIQLPPDQLETNEASIRGAEELGASGVPDAKLHLQLARDETATAKKLAAQGDDRAVVVLAAADSDAELALGLAREVSVHDDAQRAADDLKVVQARGTP